MKLIRSTAVIGAFTMVSRVLGLIRDQMLARVLGADAINDAFVTAFRFPNLFRRLFAEGAFNAAFIPLYARRLEEDGQDGADKFANEALSGLITVVGAIVIVCQLTMPWLMYAIGPGLAKPDVFNLAILYTQITMPYLLFMAVAALMSGILNSRHYFIVAAAAPILLNLVLISTLVYAVKDGIPQRSAAYWLSWGITGSGVLQAGLIYWGCRRAGVRLRLPRPRWTPGLKRLVFLGIPGAISAGITQINITVSNAIATLEKGAASWLYYADRLYQLPLGVIGIAMGVALLPTLSRRLRSGDKDGAMTSLNRAIEIAMFLTLPAAAALAVMPGFLVEGLFERGRFGEGDTQQTSQALLYFAFGLVAFVIIKVMTPAFFAREDTRTPMIYAATSVIINIVLGVTLFKLMGFTGLAIATAVAGWVNAGLLLQRLLRLGYFTPDLRLATRLPRMAGAAALMGIAIYFLAEWARQHLGANMLADYLWLGAVTAVGIVIYSLSCFITRAFTLDDVRYALKRQ